MPYVNIPESKLGIAISRLIGLLLAQLTAKVTGEINKLKERIVTDCGNIGKLQRIAKKLSGLRRFTSGIKSRIEKIRKITAPLARIISVLNIAIRLLKLLPLPNRFTTAGTTNVFSDILHKLKEFVKQLADDLVIVETSCALAITVINLIEIQLDKLDRILKLCAEDPSQNPDIQNQLLVENDINPTIIQEGLLNQDFLKIGNELFKDNQSLQDFNQKSLQEQDIFSNNLGIPRKDVAKSAFVKNISLGMNLNEALLKTKLTKQETESLFETYKKETVQPPSILSEDDTLLKNQKLSNYVGPDGTFYEIFIQATDLSKVAPRRRAVALDVQKVIRYKTDESFSYSTEVLEKEVKFKIDNDIN
jgi:hypothetical protein